MKSLQMRFAMDLETLAFAQSWMLGISLTWSIRY